MSEPDVRQEEEETKGTCRGCGREIEWCSFCDRPDCDAAICFPCVSVELGESVAQPHEHGG